MTATEGDVREVMIACRTLRTEIEHVVAQRGIDRPIIWLESKLHNVTMKLADALQEALDSVQADRVLLGYGNCGNAVQGLTTGDYELIIPRLDDCISLVIGSQRERERYGAEHHAMFYTDGWMDEGHNIIDDYEQMLERYDEDTARDVFEMMYEHYETMAYLDTGLYDVPALMEQTRFVAEMCDLTQRVEPATLSYVERLVCGPWDDDLFVHVPPRSTIPAQPFRNPGSVL